MFSEPSNRVARWRTGALGAFLWLGATPLPASAQECIPPAVERALTSCSEAPSVAPRARTDRSAPHAHAIERAPTAPPAPGQSSDLERVLDPHAAMRRRELRLIERELEVLERLAARTPASDPRRADILRRLAETLGDLAGERERHARSLDDAVFQARRRRQEAPALRQRADLERSAREARERVVRVLAELVTDHPRDARAHEALYGLGYHLTRLGQHDRARQAYQRLIRDYSASRYVPHAYLAFAEHAFAERRLDDARELYGRVLAYPPADNPLYAYARYRLAWVHFNGESYRASLDELVRVLEHLRAHPGGADAAGLERQVRRELVLPYAHVGSPDRALAFFRRFAEDEDDALSMLSRLGDLYLDTGRWSETIAVHHQLMAERPRDPSLCLWQARVLDATISGRPPDDQLVEARRLTDVRTTARTHGHPDHVTRACDERAATALVLLATAWHREAVGTAEQPGTRDRRTMARAAALYALIERELPGLDALSLPDLVADDRPTRAQLAFFHGELLYDAERWADCAQAYERALDTTRDAQLAADAAYGAVVCHDRQLGARALAATPTDEALSARPLTEDEARMARTFARFACAAPDHDELPVALYRWARLYYEANQLEQAASLFHRVASDHPGSEVGEYAANLHLDSLHMLATRRGRASCAARLAESVGPTERAFCADDAARARHADLCPILDGLRCGVEAEQAAALGRAGRHREAADAYVALVRARSCDREDIYLYNAAIQYEAARLVGRAIRVRTTLIEAFPESPLTRPSIFFVGANYHALAMYEPAADWYERYARAQGARPETCADLPAGACPDAASALEHALTFRLGLGDRAAALDDARRFEAVFARRHPERTAEVVFAIGALHVDASDWRAALPHYRRFLQRHGRHARPHRRAQAHVLVARALIATGQRAQASADLQAAVALHPSGTSGSADTSPPELDAAAALLHDAASEALFGLAEAERERFEALPFPALRGQASLARVARWASDELTPWLTRKLELLREAEQAYERVHPLGIPRWRIASAARIGDMMYGLVERVRGSPVPTIIERDPELLAAYWQALDDATEPYLEVAVQRYEACLRTATSARWFDDRSRRCEETLNLLDTVRFPLASELRGQGSWEASRGAAPGAVTL